MPVMPQLAEVAQLVGDPGRANILSTLMDGRALTAKELAIIAGVTAQTASSHLAKLVERELLTVEKRGSRRFFRLATPLVAQMLEGIMNVAVTGPPRFRPPVPHMLCTWLGASSVGNFTSAWNSAITMLNCCSQYCDIVVSSSAAKHSLHAQ